MMILMFLFTHDDHPQHLVYSELLNKDYDHDFHNLFNTNVQNEQFE